MSLDYLLSTPVRKVHHEKSGERVLHAIPMCIASLMSVCNNFISLKAVPVVRSWPTRIDKKNSKEVMPPLARQKMVPKILLYNDLDVIVPETPAQEAISAAASTAQQAPGETAMPSMASSPASALSTPSVPESLEFTETNPEGIDGIDQEAPAIEQKAPGDMVMNDTESDAAGETVEEFSTTAALPAPMHQVCQLHFCNIFRNEKFSFHKAFFACLVKTQLFTRHFFENTNFRTFAIVRKFENATFRKIFFFILSL